MKPYNKWILFLKVIQKWICHPFRRGYSKIDNMEAIWTYAQIGDVIPAKAGIHTNYLKLNTFTMDPRLDGNDTTWWQKLHFFLKEKFFAQPKEQGSIGFTTGVWIPAFAGMTPPSYKVLFIQGNSPHDRS